MMTAHGLSELVLDTFSHIHTYTHTQTHTFMVQKTEPQRTPTEHDVTAERERDRTGFRNRSVTVISNLLVSRYRNITANV